MKDFQAPGHANTLKMWNFLNVSVKNERETYNSNVSLFLPFKTIWIILLKPVKTFHFFFCSLEINFQRLRDWIGQHNGERYMVLLDVQNTQSTTALTTAGDVGIINRSRYRCVVRVVLYDPFLLLFIFFFFRFSRLCAFIRRVRISRHYP